MPFTTEQQSISALHAFNYKSFASVNAAFDQGGSIALWHGFSGLFLDVPTITTPLFSRRSELDQFVFQHGLRYTLKRRKEDFDIDSGEYEVQDNPTVYLRRTKVKGSNKGKQRRFLTTFMTFDRSKPLKNQRIERNRIEFQIIDIIEQGDNEFDILTESV